MKKILLITMLLFFTSMAFSESFRIDVNDTTLSGAPGESYVFKGYVHNTGSNATAIKMVRKSNNIPDGWTTTLCFGSSCYPAYVDAPDPIGVNPGDSIFFDIAFNTDENPGYGEAMLVFEDLGSGEKDSILFSVTTQNPPTFIIDLEETEVNGKPGDSFVMKGYVHNKGSDPVVVKMFRTANEIPETWATTLCFGSSCYPSFVNETDPVGINPGDSVFFDITFNTGLQPDTGKTLLRFEDMVSGYKDSVWFKVSTLTKPAFKLARADTFAQGVTGDSFELGGYVYNLTDSLLPINLVRVLNDLPQGWSSSLCFDICASPNVDSVNSVIAPMDSLAYTLTVYTTGTAGDSGKIRLKFYATGAYDTLYQNFSVVTTATGIEEKAPLNAKGFYLFGNYPNPFNPKTTIRYQLENQTRVKIDLFTVEGRFLKTLFNQRQTSGYHEVGVHASDLPSGIYYYRLKTQKHTAYGKMILVK